MEWYLKIRRSIKRSLLSYSRVINLAKIWMASMAALCLGLLFIYPQLKEQKSLFDFSFASDFRNSQSVQMTNIRYFSLDGKDNQLSLKAENAEEKKEQSFLDDGDNDQKPSIIVLKNPRAEALVGEQAFNIRSDTGEFDQANKIVTLKDNVEILSSDGYEFKGNEAVLDTGKKKIYSNKKVEARGSFGNITSEGMLILDNGDKVNFTGKTRLILFDKKRK